MENRVQVSIAGVAFIFSEDAYRVMRRYLDKLEAGYADNVDGREIIADIEARIAEIILEQQSNDIVVDTALAESIVSQLGYPEEIGDKRVDEEVERNFPRRLYRDSDNGKIGGVCAGLGVFFNVDPVWIRLIIFAPLILVPITGILGEGKLSEVFAALFGIFIMIYLILWFIIPKARTPRQKLEMRGERITARKIERRFSDDLQERATTAKGKKNASVWSEIIYVTGQILLFLLKGVVILVLFSLIIAVLALVTVLFGLIFAPSYMNIDNISPDVLTGISPAGYAILVMLVIIVPMAMLIYLLIRWLIKAKRPANKSFLMIAGIIWVLITVFTCVITFRNIEELRDKQNIWIQWKGGKKSVRQESDKYWRENWEFDENGRAHPKENNIYIGGEEVEIVDDNTGNDTPSSTETVGNPNGSDKEGGVENEAARNINGSDSTSAAKSQPAGAGYVSKSASVPASDWLVTIANIIKISIKR